VKVLCTTSSFDNKSAIPEGMIFVMNPFRRKLTEDEVARLIEEHQPVGMIAGVEPLTRKVLKNAKSLKVISRCGIGLDSVDLDAAKETEIIVTNTPEGPTRAVAELTIGLILSALRRINNADSKIREGKWERPMGILLYGKTVGILGCGRIGSYVARLCSVFGTHVIGHDPHINSHELCELVGKDELLEKSDVVSLHIPYSKENLHYIGKREISIMRDGAVLINASRGGLVDEVALYEALVSGKLAASAMDCFEKEPYTGDLAKLDNIVLTSHIGSYAREARDMQEKQAVENLIAALKSLGIL